MPRSRLAGYRIVQFSPSVKDALQQIAERLEPHEEEILENWIKQQYETWPPPGLSQEDLRQVFVSLLRSVLRCMAQREPYLCLSELEEAGSRLADVSFPFEALVISVHFLEKSYLPFLIHPPSDKTQNWLIAIDEFLHAALATIATAYFEAFKRTLLSEAEVGRIVQEGLAAQIPRKFADLRIAYKYVSAHEHSKIGGDFLDMFVIDPERMTFIVGDFSGHGLEAAAEAFKLRSMYRAFVRENLEPADAMRRLNHILGFELAPDRFVTALAAMYGPNGQLIVVNAGHPYPVVCGVSCEIVTVEGPLLGGGLPSDFVPREIELPRGGIFIAYTDGVTEARTVGEILGEKRLLEAVNAKRDFPPMGIADHIVDEALRFAGGHFKDDVAVLVLKRE